MSQLPKYRCHKEVRAEKISDVTRPPGNDQPFTLHLEGGEVRHVDQIWMNAKAPNISEHMTGCIGGYFVEYEDGYTSWSPAKAFEDGYTLVGE